MVPVWEMCLKKYSKKQEEEDKKFQSHINRLKQEIDENCSEDDYDEDDFN